MREFPDDYATCEPLPWGMVQVRSVTGSVFERYFGAYRRRPTVEPKHVKDDA